MIEGKIEVAKASLAQNIDIKTISLQILIKVFLIDEEQY